MIAGDEASTRKNLCSKESIILRDIARRVGESSPESKLLSQQDCSHSYFRSECDIQIINHNATSSVYQGMSQHPLARNAWSGNAMDKQNSWVSIFLQDPTRTLGLNYKVLRDIAAHQGEHLMEEQAILHFCSLLQTPERAFQRRWMILGGDLSDAHSAPRASPTVSEAPCNGPNRSLTLRICK